MAADPLTSVDAIIDDVAKIAPSIGAIVDEIPGVGNYADMGIAVLAAFAKAVDAIARSNTALSMEHVVLAWFKHNTPGQPNAPALSSSA